MSIILVSSCEEAYYPKAKCWLDSVERNARVRVAFVGYDWLPPGEDHPSIEFYKIEPDQVKVLERGFNMQHGEWLKVLLTLQDDDLVICTDCGDLVMQRPFLDREIEWLETIPEIALGYNKRPPWDNFLIEEATRLEPLVSYEELSRAFPGCDRMVCYNTGVIVSRANFYRDLYEYSTDLYPLCRKTMTGCARQQFLISYIVAEMGVTPVILPSVIHAHDCYGSPPGVHWVGDVLYAGEYPVVFKHKFFSGPGGPDG